MAFKLTVGVDQSRLAATLGRFKEMQVAIHNGLASGVDIGARHFQSALRMAYASQEGKPAIAQSTMEKRSIGKKSPYPIPKFGSTVPLSRTGRLAKNVTIRRFGRLTHTVMIHKGIMERYSGSAKAMSVERVAALQEVGFTTSITVSRKMRRYLFLLMRRSPQFAVGYGAKTYKTTQVVSRGKNNLETKIKLRKRKTTHIVVKVPARPIWGPVFTAEVSKVSQMIHAEVHKAIAAVYSKKGGESSSSGVGG